MQRSNVSTSASVTRARFTCVTLTAIYGGTRNAGDDCGRSPRPPHRHGLAAGQVGAGVGVAEEGAVLGGLSGRVLQGQLGAGRGGFAQLADGVEAVRAGDEGLARLV